MPGQRRGNSMDEASTRDDHSHSPCGCGPPTRPGGDPRETRALGSSYEARTRTGVVRPGAGFTQLRHCHDPMRPSARTASRRAAASDNVASQGQLGGEDRTRLRQHALPPVDSFFQVIAARQVAHDLGATMSPVAIFPGLP